MRFVSAISISILSLAAVAAPLTHPSRGDAPEIKEIARQVLDQFFPFTSRTTIPPCWSPAAAPMSSRNSISQRATHMSRSRSNGPPSTGTPSPAVVSSRDARRVLHIGLYTGSLRLLQTTSLST
ncbi:hypothetical protein FB451DRAFT_1292248, partial [Mycena latifolia]